MEITFEQDYLRELFYEGRAKDKKHRFQPQIVRKYIKVLNLMESLDSTQDLDRLRLNKANKFSLCSACTIIAQKNRQGWK